MLRLAPIRALYSTALLATLSLGGCSCEPTVETVVSLAFVAPNPGARIQLSDDLDPGTPGVQVNVKLRAVGLNSTDTTASVSLLNKSDVDGAAVTATVTDGAASFTNVTLVSGTNEFEATLSHDFGGDVVVKAAYSVVAPGGPACRFSQAPNGPALSAGATLSNDVDLINAGFQTHIGVTCAGEGVADGQLVGLNVAGAPSALDATLSDGVAVFTNVSLPEGAARLTTYVLINGEQSGTASLEINVDTGRCDVAVTSPANGVPILAVNDADPSTAAIADVDVVVSSTRCGENSTVTIVPAGGSSAEGALDNTGTATVRVTLEQSADATDLKNFDVVITDASASRNQGSSLRQVHLVDTIAPGLEVVGLAEDGSTVLTAANDQDDNPIDDLTYRLQVRASNAADVSQVYARVGDDEAGAVAGAPNELGVVTLDVRLPSGQQTITVYASDAAGNQASVTRQVEVDITVPVVTLLQPAQSGAVLAAADADPQQEGFQLDCYVQVANFSALEALGDPRVFCELQTLDAEGNATGPWVESAMATPQAGDNDVGVGGIRLTLANGHWGIRAGAVTRGGLGNRAAPSSPLNLNVDGTAPTISFASPGDGQFINSGDATIELAVTDAEEGQPVTITVNAGAALDPAPTVDANGRAVVEGVAWATQDGEYILTADVSDVAGNPAAQATVTVRLDSTVPGLSLVGLDGSSAGAARDIVADGTLNATQNINLDWGADVSNGFQYGFRATVTNEAVGQLVSLRLNGASINGATVDDGEGNHVANFTNGDAGYTLLEGANSLAVTVTDPAGNTTTVNAVVTVTTGQPFVRILTPVDGANTNNSAVGVTASSNAADGAACSLVASLNGQADVTANANAGGDGSIDFGSIELTSEGLWSLVATCPFDGRDPVASAASSVNLDTTGPTLTFVGLPQINNANVFTASDAPDSTQGNRYRRHITVSAAANGACTIEGVNPTAMLNVTGGGVDAQNIMRSSFTPGEACSFRFDAVALADEVNDPNSSVTLAVGALDLANNAGAATAAVLVDRVGPTMAITDPVNNAQLSTDDDADFLQEGLQYRVSATISGAAPGSNISLLDGNNSLLQERVELINPRFPVVTFAQDGPHALKVTGADEYANPGESAVVNIVTDANAPVVSVFSPYEGRVYGIANDANPQLVGYQVDFVINVSGVDPGAVVIATDSNQQEVGRGTVAGPTVAIAGVVVQEGEQTITVSTTDGINSATDTVTITVDLTRPTASDCTFVGDDGAQLAGVLVFNKAEDGNANSAGWQGSCDVTVLGAEAGSAVRVVSNNPAPGTTIGSAVWAENGATRVPLTLSDGAHTLTVVAVDSADNANEPGIGQVARVDITPPVASITGPGAGATLLADVDVDQGAEGMQYAVTVSTDAEVGTSVSVQAGGNDVGTGTVANGAASVSVTLPEGAVSLTAVSTDEAGNPTTSAAVAVTVDSIAPTVSVTSPAGGALFGDDDDADNGTDGFQIDVTVATGQVENGQRVSLRSTVGGERCSGTTDGNPLTLRCTLLEGEDQQLTAVVSDTSGNQTTSAAVVVTVNLVAPTLVFTMPNENPANLNASDDADNGTDGLQYSFVLASDAAGQTVTLREGGNSLGTGVVANGAVTIGPLTLTEGSHNLVASVTQDGNTTAANLSVTVDVTAPTITMTTPNASPHTYDAASDQQAGAPLNTTFTFNVAGAVGGTLSGASDQTASIGTVAINADGAVSITGATLNSGLVHAITFTLTDAAGNTATTALSATVDVVAPLAMTIAGAVQNNRTGTVRLTWNEPGDDADVGTVTGYQVRYSTTSINEGNFAQATQASEAMVPQAAGAAMQVDIAGLPFDDASVFIAARAVDDVGNTAPLGGGSAISVSTAFNEFTYTPAGRTGYFGWKICTGDFNNDNRSDLVVTDRAYGAGATGAVHILTGAANAAQMTSSIIVGGTNGGRFGVACATADFNEDGFDDLVVGAAWEGNGNVYIYRGSAQGLSNTPIATLNGASGNFGYGVSAKGSLTGDATPDLVVTAYRYGATAGRAYVYDGDNLTGTIAVGSAVATVTGRDGSKTGLALVAGLDVTGDNNADIVVGASAASNSSGEVLVAEGPFANGDALAIGSDRVRVLSNSLQDSNQLGRWLTVGDLDGDGTAEVIGGYNSGQRKIAIWQGGANLNAGADRTLPVPTNSVGSRELMEDGACDINGDGRYELMSGSTNKVFLWHGAQTLAAISEQPNLIYDVGVGDWDKLICAGDLNADDKPDLAIVVRGSSGKVVVRY